MDTADHHVTRLEPTSRPLDRESHVGPYRLIREIGHGGMGTVYLGVRDDDAFQKRVAIKVLKRGMDTDAIVRRFRNERQILAGLEHLDRHINEWLDNHPDAEVKFSTITAGEMGTSIGKESVVVVQVWI